MSLCELVRNMRKRALLSQEDFAKLLNVSVGTINRWENGKTKPNITAMKKIKAYCEDKSIPFEEIESEWLKDKE
ncbi:MAG: helix-turn-helix domain-containing protein [Lachnospiraceae bacterium]|nr:helix-turn-helix domain-containing protein [Lachnospiraceae bacterium]